MCPYICPFMLRVTYKIVVNTSARTLTLYKDGKWFKSFPVAVGIACAQRISSLFCWRAAHRKCCKCRVNLMQPGACRLLVHIKISSWAAGHVLSPQLALPKRTINSDISCQDDPGCIHSAQTT